MQATDIREIIIECLREKLKGFEAEKVEGFNFCAVDIETEVDGKPLAYRIAVLKNVSEKQPV